MAECTGLGECFDQCICICCEDEECKIPSEICTCGHRDHEKFIGGDSECDIYCKEECPYNCKLIECHNYKLCNKKLPQREINCDNGMCYHCAVNIGKIKFLEIKDECPICMENKDMIEITCGKHKVCLDCWKKVEGCPRSCPLCRENIWKWKGR